MSRSPCLSIVFGALATLAAPVALAQAPAITYLDQGWSKEIRELYYFTPQGSRTIPYAWFMALERPDGPGMFADSAYLQRFGLIPADGPHQLNPGNLPIGLALDPRTTSKTGQDLGLTCAACHTADITVEGRRIRIDGGASNFDFDSFYSALAAAVTRTTFDPAVFQRFAARIITSPSPTAAAELQLQFTEFQAKIGGEAVIRRPALASGFGRVDAMTQIVNAISVLDQGDPLNVRAVNAPTSYPSLWLAPHLEFVQWNADRRQPDRAQRRRGAGRVRDRHAHGRSEGLVLIQHPAERVACGRELVADLKPPKWDEPVSRPDQQSMLAAKGEELFSATLQGLPQHARRTVAPIPTQNLFGKTFIEIGRVHYRSIGTDTVLCELVPGAAWSAPTRPRAATERRPSVVPAAAYLLRTAGAILSTPRSTGSAQR